MADLSLTNIHKSFGDIKVIHGVDLEVEAGEFTVFVGPSGCGKSTLLRMIAGLESVTNGSVAIAGAEATIADKIVILRHINAETDHRAVTMPMAASGAGISLVTRGACQMTSMVSTIIPSVA